MGPETPAGVLLRVPRVLAADLGGHREVVLPVPGDGRLVGLLDQLVGPHPALARRLRDETGTLRRFVNMYVDGLDVRRSDGLATPVGVGQTVEVIQSVAGG
ncbi:MoaD/ThiS family protein [Aquipuribacter sp. MA13-6]|uniref:MoaD/ThiS family protein n=1 Tax=unclassified Aquipuribacter TaxID=2635084 RepID=UPI003EEEB5D8